jgi:hypothetical protein
MNLGWKWLIPLSLGWLLLVAGSQISKAWGYGIFAGIIVAALMLAQARATARRRRARLGGPATPAPPELLAAPTLVDGTPVGG